MFGLIVFLLLLIVTGAGAAGVVLFVRKLGESKSLVTGMRTSHVRLEARFEYSAERLEIADASNREMTALASNSVEMTREVLGAMGKIDQVADQMNTLLGLATEGTPELRPRGRHHALSRQGVVRAITRGGQEEILP